MKLFLKYFAVSAVVQLVIITAAFLFKLWILVFPYVFIDPISLRILELLFNIPVTEKVLAFVTFLMSPLLVSTFIGLVGYATSRRE